MREKLHNIKNEALSLIMSSGSRQELDELHIRYLGKKGQLVQLAQSLKILSIDEKKDIGQVFNDVKDAIETALKDKQSGLKTKSSQLSVDLDLTLPGTSIPIGFLHPITAVARQLNSIFQSLGFSIADGPEIETEEFNFSRLNLPPDHPGRDLQDSLYIKDPDIVLRTHTSSVEAHILADHKPPFRFVFPGKAYRFENVSATNHMMFFQYQGLAVDKTITLANLKWTLNTFITKFYGPSTLSRFRCKYYPEVEPGVGVDISCPFCHQSGCAVCKYRGWIEVMGAGMVHPNMLKKVNLDPQVYSGFAWGMGLDRIVMTKYNLSDIRALFNGQLIYKL